MTLFDVRVTTTVNWLGAPRCLRQMKRCSEQEETTSIAKRSTVLGCSISFVSAFGENSFITYLVLSPKGKPFWAPLQGDYVSDRKSRWFESKRGQKQKILSKDGIFCFIQYLSLVKCAGFSNELHLSDIFLKLL